MHWHPRYSKTLPQLNNIKIIQYFKIIIFEKIVYKQKYTNKKQAHENVFNIITYR